MTPHTLSRLDLSRSLQFLMESWLYKIDKHFKNMSPDGREEDLFAFSQWSLIITPFGSPILDPQPFVRKGPVGLL